MSSLKGFDANKYPDERSTILPGEYQAIIVATEMKVTKAGTGQYLQLEFLITEGKYKGRKMWDRLNLRNPNPTAENIARVTLGNICRAVGVLNPPDSEMLHSVPLMIKIGLQDDDPDRNEVTGYSQFQDMEKFEEAIRAKYEDGAVSARETLDLMQKEKVNYAEGEVPESELPPVEQPGDVPPTAPQISDEIPF